MRNRGFARARMFLGGVMLLAAAIAWHTGLWLSPTSEATAGVDGVRGTIVTVIRNSAIAVLVLSALAAWLLFPSRRPRWPARDYVIGGAIGLLVLTSLYQLFWVQTSVAN